MARKAKAVDIYQFGDMNPYIDDSDAYARERYPDRTAALAHAVSLNALLPETWNMRDRRARFEQMKQDMLKGTPPDQLSPYDWNSVYDIISRHDKQLMKDLDAKFFAWYDANPHFEPVYQTCKNNHWISFVHEGITHDRETVEKNGWLERPPNFYMFRQVMRQSDARQHMELNRALPFEEGDIVFLRKPYAGKWRIDPFPELDAGEVRLGTVLALTDTTKSWRASKGSRMIDVLWIGTPNQKKQVPVRCLKLSARAGRSK